MSMQQTIATKVRETFNPQFLDVENESHNHGGPATESHYKLTVVSESFSKLSLVKRHQSLYGLLAEEMKGSVHALALHLYTPQEWEARQSDAPNSPDCKGGSKG